jgi:POT family proton-dependent oligopeptide transporter
MSEAQQKGHPKGLWVLFGTEMWERFNFYGMRAILTLFMVNALMMKESQSSLIYGGFLGLCYLTPMLGGFISDRYLGNRKSIMLGGVLMAIGQILLFCSATIFDSSLGLANTLLWIALAVIIFGNGFFKPNISSMVSSLYPKTEKNKLDTAFTIFYMGINLGALFSQWLVPLIADVKDAAGNRDIFAFKWGFLLAGIAMILGTVIFYLLKDKYVVTPEGNAIGGVPKKGTVEIDNDGETNETKFTSKALAGACIGFGILALTFYFVLGQNIIYSIIYASGLALAGLIITDPTLTKIERDRILVIYIIAFFVIFFWAAFEQAGSSLTFIADYQTDRNFLGWNMPASMVQIFNGLFVVILAVPFSMLWDKLRAKGREPISPMKQAIGLIMIALSYFIIAHNVKALGIDGKLAIKWLVLLYFIQTIGELCLSPIGLSLVGKLAPKRFTSLLYGVFFLSNAAGYALAGTLGSILPPTGDKYKDAKEVNVELKDVLDGKTQPDGKGLFHLATLKLASVDAASSKANNIDVAKKIENVAKLKTEREKAEKLKKPFVNTYKDSDTTFTEAEFSAIKDKGLIKVTPYPSFAGFVIKDLYDFFMVFVVLCGIAAAILLALVPTLKKMMHGVR